MLDGRLKHSLENKSEYRGCCDDYGRRDGFGSEIWKKQEQIYEGRFFKDTFHGEGSYKWSAGKEKRVFEGFFYSNFKEGYGVVSFPDGSVFEGLFYKNQAFGPGILTHVNGRQDVGFWSGNKIVRLSRSVDFIIPRLASTTLGKLKLLRFQAILPFAEENADVGAALLLRHGVDPSKCSRLYSNFIHDPRSLFFNRIRFDRVYFVKMGGSIREEGGNSVSDRGYGDELERASINVTENLEAKSDIENFAEDETNCEMIHVIAWNRSELCMEMLKQIFRFRSFEDELSFKISDLMSGDRTKFRKTGERERFAMHFLKMCSVGPSYIVKDMLCTGNISEELMDARGNNSVMFAAARDQRDVIEVLLNHGADVNSFNDENLTPLNFCLLRRISETYSLGNWEVSFLPPDTPPLIFDEAKNKICDIRKSMESLDRIFGDGMSIDSEIAVGEKTELGVKDSVFCFQGETDSRTGTSDITLLRYRTEEPEELNVRSISRMTGHNEKTMEVGKGFCPLSYRREEFLKTVAAPTDKDKYFFDLSVENARKTREIDGFGRGAEGEDYNERIMNIDKTIELLLIRGADPNLADAPKPSIHLAVYCQEPNLVRLLLMYGASPDTQSLPQEGLLTPLHVVVLMTPSREQVEICDLLLNYGASPEEETSPTFDPNEEERFLDSNRGRTPLQLLCTRQDAEYVDEKGFLRQVVYLLAGVSRRNNLYKGHSYLTLAMMSGNYGIMQALLTSKRTNPNEILGNDLGTSFHVLVSTDLQKRTSFEKSILMCDMLLDNGGDPSLKFETPQTLSGTCVDYGYREIEKEKKRRETLKNEIKKKFERDHLEDHVKVVEYIAKKSKWEPKDTEGIGPEERRYKTRGKDKSENERRDAKKDDTNSEKLKRISNENSKILEIKKHVSVKKDKINSKMTKLKKNASATVEKADVKMTEWEKSVSLAKEKFNPKVAERKNNLSVAKEKAEKSKNVKKETDGKVVEETRSAAKEKLVGRSCLSERFPERFRQSLLHTFGICGGEFNLNEFLLPYVVLRNGDLYYRFKGHKLSRTEQYSLI